MRRIFIILFVSFLAFSCNKEASSYIDLPSVNEGFEFGASGGKCLGTVISNTDFEITSDSQWCTVVRYKDKSINNFRIDVEENLYAIKRVATITVSADGCEDRTIRVRQSAAEPLLSVDKTFWEFDQNAADFSLEVTTNLKFKTSMPDWISMEGGAGEMEMGRNRYTFYVKELDGSYRKGSIVFEAVDYPDMRQEVSVRQISSEYSGDLVIFQEDFAWTESLFDNTYTFVTSAVSPDKWPSEAYDAGWTTSIHTGCGEVGTIQAKAATGFLTLPFYAKRPTNLITPALSKISGTADLVVSFKACSYFNGSAKEGYREIHVSCLGPGTVSCDFFAVENIGTNKDDSWQEDPAATYTFEVSGATGETQIVFHFGPLRDSSDNMTKDISEIPAGEANCNCRMGFDDIKIISELEL